MIFSRYIFSFIIALIVCVPAAARPLPSPVAVQLAALINAARRAPLDMAAALGEDPDVVRERLPELEAIFESGIPPVSFNSELMDSATSHAADMLARQYYAVVSPEGDSVVARMALAGYPVGIGGEALGMLAFLNYVSPEAAVVRIFENMFLDELDPARTAPRQILNPTLQDIGIGFVTGQWQLQGVPYSVYLVACDFAVNRMTWADLGVFCRINQARFAPARVGAVLGIPEAFLSMQTSVAPLTLNPEMVDAARAHVADMLAQRYFATVSLDGATVRDRLVVAGYDAAMAGEVIASRSDNLSLSAMVMARTIIEDKLRSALDARKGGGYALVAPYFRDIGMGFGSLALGGEQGNARYHLAAMDVAKSVDAGTEVPSLVVIGFRDTDRDGLYSIGEGRTGIAFEIEDDFGNRVSFATGKAGYFSYRLDPGHYRLYDGVDTVVDFEVGTQNVLQWLLQEDGWH